MAGDTSNIDIYAIMAYIGSTMLAIGPLYQTYKMYKKKHTKDVSMKWNINYVIGLTLVSIFSLVNSIWPIFISGIVELINMLILIGYKIYIEQKIFCIDWGGKLEVHQINLNEFNMEVTSTGITLSTTHEKLEDTMDEKSNDDDNVFQFNFTKEQLISMIERIDNNPNKSQHDVNFNDLHLKVHDNENDDINILTSITTVDENNN
jgi:uncharacterized protein with PQ loop repeat